VAFAAAVEAAVGFAAAGEARRAGIALVVVIAATPELGRDGQMQDRVDREDVAVTQREPAGRDWNIHGQ
jgi:hypothetical protein